MAKKTVSFSLEEDIVNAIKDYKEQKKLSSNSTALERMILIFTNFNLGDNSYNNKIKKEDVKEDTDLDKSIKDMFSNMPE